VIAPPRLETTTASSVAVSGSLGRKVATDGPISPAFTTVAISADANCERVPADAPGADPAAMTKVAMATASTWRRILLVSAPDPRPESLRTR
jgi:hypothetical protein